MYCIVNYSKPDYFWAKVSLFYRRENLKINLSTKTKAHIYHAINCVLLLTNEIMIIRHLVEVKIKILYSTFQGILSHG